MTAVANEKILFIHIPKTGGTWVSEAMEAAGVQVEPAADDHHPEKPELEIGDRFAFAFVREPLSWYRSIWKFHRRNPLTHWTHIGESIDLDFPDFLEHMIESYPGYLGGYYRMFVGAPHDPIDFVGRHEHLSDDLVTALRLAGQEFDEDVLRAVPARNFDNEESLYGSLLPPPERSGPEDLVSEDLKDRLKEAEYEVYERFYAADDAGRRPRRGVPRDMAPDPIIIYGAPRSGTTYLQQILNAHPDVFISHETRVFAWLHHALAMTKDDRLVLTEREAFLGHLRTVLPNVMREFNRSLAPGVRYWGDKNPHYADPFNDGCLETVAELFPGSVFVHIIRDGRDVVSSLIRKRDEDKPWVTFDQAHFTWSRHVQRGSAFGRALSAGRYFELRYEDLVADDVERAAALFRFLGLAFAPAVEAFCRGQQDKRTPFKDPTRELGNGVTASDWPVILDPEQQAHSLKLLGPDLVRYGYETEDSLEELRKQVDERLHSPTRAAAPSRSAEG